MERYFGKSPKISLEPEVIQSVRDYARLSDNGCFFGGAFFGEKNEFNVFSTFLFEQVKPAYAGYDPTLDMKSWEAMVKLESKGRPDNFNFAFMGIAIKENLSAKTLSDKEIQILTKSIGSYYSKAIYLKVNKSGEIGTGIIDFANKYLFENIPYDVDTTGYGESDAVIKADISKFIRSFAPSTYAATTQNNNSYNNSYNSNYNSNYNNKKPEPYKEANINIKNPDLIALTGDKMSFNYEGFKLICMATQENLRRYLSKRLEEVYGVGQTTITKDYIFCKGQLPMMLVAHMDTVHKNMPDKILYDKELGEIYSPDGIGGDDRCGIYGVISVLMASKNDKLPSVLLTMDEETGCLGAKSARLQLKDKIDGINFLVELDRHGKDHAVYYNTTNKDFVEHISKYGFSVETGMGSDIKYLSDEWNIASANLSIGYYNEHTLRETVVVKDMMDTIKKTRKIVDESIKTRLFTKTKVEVLPLPARQNYAQ